MDDQVSVAQDKDHATYLTWKGFQEYTKLGSEVTFDVLAYFESSKYISLCELHIVLNNYTQNTG